MPTINYFEEKLPESEEVFFPMAHLIDDASIYHDLVSMETISDEDDDDDDDGDESKKEIQIFSRARHGDEQIFRVIPSIIDGYIFNLIRIIDDHHPNPQSVFLHDNSSDFQQQTSNALIKIIIDIGGTDGPLSKRWRSSCNQTYFQKWYLDQHQRSASMINQPSMTHSNDQTKETSNDNLVSETSKLSMDETTEDQRLQEEIQRIYGFDDGEAAESVTSDRWSFINEKPSNYLPMSPVILNLVSNGRNHPSITVREYYPSIDRTALVVDRSLSNSSFVSESTHLDSNENVLNEYDQVLEQHPDVHQDPNPKIITEPNPNSVTYKQNITVRYLVPPTPPPPGPLIIRETIPPPASSPSPLIITQRAPSPTTPSPIILREAPPTPPLPQEPTIIHKVVPTQSTSIVEQEPSLPAKPPSIIIEKWLPYKPAPPREVIYERVIEAPMVTQFQPQRHISEFDPHASSQSQSVHREIPSNELSASQQPSLFDQIAQATQEQIEALERRTREQIEAQQRWMENQWEQHNFLYMPVIPVMTTPALIVNHPPIIRNTDLAYGQEATFQEHVYIEPSYLYPFY